MDDAGIHIQIYTRSTLEYVAWSCAAVHDPAPNNDRLDSPEGPVGVVQITPVPLSSYEVTIDSLE